MHHTKQNIDLGRIYEYTCGIVFLGTPHRGSEKTGYADMFSKIARAALRQPNKKLVEVLKQDSDVLEAQRTSFSAISKDLPIACLYEAQPVNGIGKVCTLSAKLSLVLIVCRSCVSPSCQPTSS